MPEHNVKKQEPTATVGDVLKAFWQGMRAYKWQFVIVITAIIVTNILQVYVPLLYRQFFDVITATSSRQTEVKMLVFIIVKVFILNSTIWLLVRTATFVQNIYQSKAISTLKQQAFEKLLDHSYTFFANNFTGSLTQRVNRFARSFDVLGDRIMWSIIPLSTSFTGILIVLWRINFRIALVIIGWVVILFVFNYFYSIWKLPYDLKNAEIDSAATAILSDVITNQNAVELFTGYHYEQGRFRDITNEQARASTLSWNLAAVIDSVQAGFLVASEFLLFFISIHYWQIGVFSVGTFVLIQVYFINLGGRLWDLSRIVRNLYESFADAKEMVDTMKLPVDVKDMPHAKKLELSKGELEFKRITFSFNKTRTVLHAISLKINQGEKVAIIGPSGAGKSTFVRLILRFYDPASGAILIDGQDIKSVTQESLRQNISLVPQDPVLFHRTLKENIRYGQRDATDEQISDAGKKAHCDEFINNLPLGYDTYVGERGIKLSGGERQRVAIARAILKNAPILILDEATSSLDSHSESLIQDGLDTLMKGKTVIVIAHRLSTIRKMDRIIVLDDGRIVEEGNHESLLNQKDSLYKKLWDLQAGGFIQESEERSGI